MDTKIDPLWLQTWRLFITAHAKLIGEIDQRLREAHQIPLNSYDVLIELYEATNHHLRMSDLADRVLLTRSGLTRLVDKLEQDGLLRREVDPQDRRGFYANLTEAGIEAMRQAWPVYAEGISTLFVEHISREEAVSFSRVFARMIEATQEADESRDAIHRSER
jgi:DNA-binding MarR family transcriptional regulator